MRIIPVLIITPLPKETDQLLRFFTSNKHYQYPSPSNNYNTNNSKKHPIATITTHANHHPINNINNINNSSSNGGASTSNSYHNLHITTTNNHHASHPNPHHTHHHQQQQQHMRRGSTHNNNSSNNSSGSATSNKNSGVASNSSMIRPNMTFTPTTPTSPTSITGNNHHSHVFSHQHHHNNNNSNNSDCVCYYYKKRGTNSKVSEWHIEDFQPAQQQQQQSQSQSQNKNVNTLEKVLFKVTHTGARHAPSLRQALYKQAIENKSLIVFLFSYTKKVHVNIQLLKGSLSSMNHHHVRTELQHKHDRNVGVVVNGVATASSSVVSAAAAAASAAIVVAAADDDENENNDQNVDKMMNNKQEKKNKKRVSKSASRKSEERKSSSPLAGHEKEAAMRASMNTIIHYCPSLYKTVEVYMREFAELYYQLEYTDRREAWSDDDLNFWLSTRQQMIVNNINNMSGGDNHHKNLLVKRSESENDGDGEQEEDEEHDSGVGHASHVANSKRKSVSRKKKKNREDDEEREMLLVPLRKSTSKAQSDAMQQHCNNNISNFTFDHMNNNRNSVETNAPLSPERKLRNVSVKRNAIPVSASQSQRSNRVSLPTPSSTLLTTPLANGSGDKTKKLMSLPLEANKKDKKSVDKDDNNKKGTSSLTSLSLAQFNHANDKSKTENQNHWLHQNTLFLNSGCFMMAAHVDLHEMTKDSMSDCRRQLFNETTYRPLFEDRSCVEFDLNLGINVNELFHRFYTQYQDKDNMKLLLSLKSLKHPEQPHLWLYSDSLEKSSTTHPVHEHDDQAPSLSLDSKRISSSKKTMPNLDTPLLDRTYKSTPLEHRHSIENLIDMIQKSVQTDNHQHQKLIDELDHEHHSNRSKLQLNKIFPTKFFGLKKKSKDGSNNKSTRDRLINGATVKGLETNILLIRIPDKFVMTQHHRGDHQDDESSSLKGEDNRATRSDTFFHDRVHFPLPFPYYHQHTQKVRSSVLHKNDLHTVYHHSGITKPRQKYPIIVQTNKHRGPRNNNHQSGADPNPDGNKNNGQLNQRENNGNTPRTPRDDNKLVAESEFLENESCWADDPTENDLYGETTDGNSDTTEDDISDDEHNYDSSSSNRHISLVSNSSVQPLLRKGASVHHSGFTTGDSMMESNANSSDLFDPDSLIDNDEFTFTSDMMTEFETVCGSEHSASLLSSELYDIQSSIVRGSDLQTYLGRSTYDFQSSSANDNSSLDVVSM